MHVEIIVEERSAEEALSVLVPRIAPGVTCRIHAHQGKQDLLRKLAGRLRGYSSWLPRDWRIAVLVDADEEDCRDLKQRLEAAAQAAGLTTRSSRGEDGQFIVLNRIAVKELEAWLIGDMPAVRAAFPNVPESAAKKSTFRDPDGIAGGTWEALHRLLKAHGHAGEGYAKIETARRIAEHMDPEVNCSSSFRTFRDGLRELVGEAPRDGRQVRLFWV